jgi:hypothetical protein
MLSESSKKSIVYRNDDASKNSGELLWKGIRRFVLLRVPLDAVLLQVDEEHDALLPSHPMGSGVVSIGGSPENGRRELWMIARY